MRQSSVLGMNELSSVHDRHIENHKSILSEKLFCKTY